MKRSFLAVLLCVIFGHISYGFGVSKIHITIQQTQDSTFSAYYKIADSLYKEKEYPTSLSKALKALDKAESNQDSKQLYEASYLIGKLWYKTQSYERSKNYFERSLKALFKVIKSENPEVISDNSEVLLDNYEYVRNNYKLGQTYQKMFEIFISKERNLGYILTSKDSVKKPLLRDSLFYYYKRIIASNSSAPKIFKLKALAYNNMAGQYLRDSLYDKAEEYTLKPLEMKKETGGNYSIATSYNALSNIYYVRKQYKKSLEILHTGLTYLEGLEGEKEDKLRAAFYLNIAYSKYRLKDYMAFEYQDKAWGMYEKLSEVENERILASIEADRNFDKGVREGVFQEALKRERTERNSWILGISLVSVIVFLGFLLNQNRLRRKNLRLALSQKETESQMQVLNANLIGQEEERKRISQELHDGVLGRLFGSRMGLGYLELDGDPQTQEQYQQFLEELQNIEKDIREVSHQLSSDISLSETSFLNAVNQLLKEKSKLGNFEFQLKMDDGFSWKDLDGILEMNLFRILQESLQNIIKHAKAKHVFVSFKVENQELYFSVKDDGVGFDTTQKAKGIGLKNIQSRVQNMKGIVVFTSNKHIGTKIDIRIPL